MDTYQRHLKIWKVLYVLISPWLPRMLHYEFEPIRVEGPILLVCNHVTSWDSLLVAMPLGMKQIYYVASEHVLRSRFGKFLNWMVAPIPRKKAAASLETVRACLNHLRKGHSVCLFAEGEQSWDGCNVPVVQGSGSLAKAARVTLVTYRLEGGYLAAPRWGHGFRKGSIRGRLAGVYPYEKIARLSGDELNELMNRDIHEDAWERQAARPVRYRGRTKAEYLERALYLCPSCRKIGTLKSEGDQLTCSCGLSVSFTELGAFDPDTPFSNIAAWDKWQQEQLRNRSFLHPDEVLFRDENVTLSKPGQGQILGKGVLEAREGFLLAAGHSFPLKSISDMAMTQSEVLLFTVGNAYYEIRAGGRTNLRKYLELWKQIETERIAAQSAMREG